MTPDVIDTENVGMIECACGLCFLFEAVKAFNVLGEGSGQHFDRHVATKFDVAGAINLTHAAFANFGDDCVLSDVGVGGYRFAHSRVVVTKDRNSEILEGLPIEIQKVRTSNLFLFVPSVSVCFVLHQQPEY